ncbi:hypothetical protein ACJIZ3_021359 [Penstemon smallii]|uniref:Uncharacterized protein n=1 Tax=Penstemon smallii TaxID=265156 RepID=A0ABD3SLG6_9LAMI
MIRGTKSGVYPKIYVIMNVNGIDDGLN